jgi:hypothetical protein
LTNEMPSTPSSSTASQSAAKDSICDQCGTNTGLERIDGTKLNDLLDNVRDRLCRDAHGNFFIKGAKTGKDTRHGQLGDLFSLLSRLEDFKSTMDRYIALHMPKPVVKPERSVTVNQIQSNAIKEIVDEHVANRIRDLQIRCSRLEEAQKKGVKGLTTTWVPQTVDEPVSAAEMQELKASIEGLELMQACNAGQIELQAERIDSAAEALNSLDKWQESMTGWKCEQSEDLKALDKAVTELTDKLARLKRKTVNDDTMALLNRAVHGLQQWQAKIDDWKDCKDTQAKAMDEAVEELQVTVSDIDEKLGDVAEWKGGIVEWRAKVDEDVQILYNNID